MAKEKGEKGEKTNLYLLAIVAIVAVVGIVVLILNSDSSGSWSSSDVSGQATEQVPKKACCYLTNSDGSQSYQCSDILCSMSPGTSQKKRM